MARRIHGLVGPGVGPKLRVGEATRLQAEINGMKTGEVTVTLHHSEDNESCMVIGEPGQYDIPVVPWVSFEYSGKCMAICSLKVD